MSLTFSFGEFLEKRGVDEPDGRPLYAYRCTDAEYIGLRDSVREAFSYGQVNGARFCIFAAESFHRNHESGPWSWNSALPISGLAEAIQQHYPEIRRGLRYWKRPLLERESGAKIYLMTLAIEGGLPLKLLANENGNLRHFFSSLLRAMYLSPERDFLELAKEKISMLPNSLRQNTVEVLSVDLLQKIMEIQKKVPEDEIDSILYLESHVPNWKSSLPVSMENHICSELIDGLVRDSRKYSLKSHEKFTAEFRLLRISEEEWVVERQIQIPEKISLEGLTSCLGRRIEDTVVRLTGFIESEGRVMDLFQMTRRRIDDEDVFFIRCIDKRLLKTVGDSASEELEVRVNGYCGNLLHLEKSDFRTPWVFEVTKGNRLLGTGSISTQQKEGLILSSLEPSSGRYKKIGILEGDVALYSSLDDRLIFKDSDAGSYLVQFNAEKNESVKIEFHLEPIPEFLGGNILKGLPDIQLVEDPSNVGMIIEWKPVGADDNPWSRELDSCLGDVWIRCRRADMTLLERRRFKILPRDIDLIYDYVTRTIKVQSSKRFRLTLIGQSAEKIGISEANTGKTLTALQSTATSEVFDLKITFPHCAGVEATLLAPVPDAYFSTGGRPLPEKKTLLVHELSGVSGEYKNMNVSLKYSIECLDQNNQVIGDSFCHKIAMQEEHSLSSYRERVASQLTLIGESTAWAELTIIDESRMRTFKELKVCLYNMDSEVLQGENGDILLKMDLLQIPHADRCTASDIEWKIISLTEEDKEVSLELIKQDFGRPLWAIPTECLATKDLWMFYGTARRVPRIRPFTLSLGNETSFKNSLVEKIVNEENLNSEFNNLREYPNHHDWSVIRYHLSLTDRFPAILFNSLRDISKDPDLLAILLVHSQQQELDLAWGLAHGLPFSWHLLPFNSWKKAYLSLVKGSLESLDSESETLRNYVKQALSQKMDWLLNRQGFLKVFKCLSLPEVPWPKVPSVFFKDQLSVAWQEHLGRSHPDEEYPIPEFMRDYSGEIGEFLVSPHPIDVMERIAETAESVSLAVRYYLPAICACWAFVDQGQWKQPTLLFELQQVRKMDPEWFDSAFEIHYTYLCDQEIFSN